MILIKKLFVTFVGWLAFQSIYVAFVHLNAITLHQSLAESIAANLPDVARFAVAVFIAILFGYLAYSVSIMGVVVPLAIWSRLIAQRPRVALFSEWLFFFTLWFILSLLVEMFAPPVLIYTSASGSLEIPLDSVGSTAVSVWLYLQTVLAFDTSVPELSENIAG